MTRVTTHLNRQKLVALMAAGYGPAEAAAALGISIRSVYRALKYPDVRAALDEFHSQRMPALLDASMTLTPDALLTLKAMMDSPIVSPAAKIAAARAALAAMAAIIPLADTERRIASLEEKLSADPLHNLLDSEEWRTMQRAWAILPLPAHPAPDL